MRSTSLTPILPILALTSACASAHPVPERILLTGTDPFITARRFVLRSHVDPRFEGTRRMLEQTNDHLLIRIVRPHGKGRDVVEVTFLNDAPGTRIALRHWHEDTLGRRGPCDLSPYLEEAVAELLTTPDPGVDERLGTMALSSRQPW
jgi:hypothetical protein